MLHPFDFFWRTENKDPEKVFSVENSRQMRLLLPEDTSIEQALAAAHAQGMSKGSYRSGCHEVQGPRGIWLGTNARKIVPSKTNSFSYKTWQQLEDEE